MKEGNNITYIKMGEKELRIKFDKRTRGNWMN